MTGTYHSFAKINLFLYVTGKRDDGYHNLCSLMTQIDLCDDIHLDFSAEKTSVVCNHPKVPEDDSNLVIKAVNIFNEYLKKKGDTPKYTPAIEIIKRIPPGGGLGGGSSNAAVVLSALNKVYGGVFDKSKLMEIGLELGADVPFFIFNHPALAKGVGEQLEKLSNLKPYYLVLCDPGVAASTAKVFKNIDFRLTSNQKDNIKSGLNALLEGREFDVRGGLHNDLEEPACRLYPEIRDAQKEMELLLGQQVYMTGSGASLFSLFQDRFEAERGKKLLEDKLERGGKQFFLCAFKKN